LGQSHPSFKGPSGRAAVISMLALTIKVPHKTR